MLVAYLAMDGVLPAARQTAIDKAYTAIMFSRDTVELEERVKTDPTYRQMVQTDPRLTFWAGGVVLREHRSNWIVGALAVSGRKSDKDHELANAARLKQEATWRSK
jgi:uncharacterized protein GlcG (DUF336 family)